MTGEDLVFCDRLDRGDLLAEELNVPFVHGSTTSWMRTSENNRAVNGSRIADEGLSLRELDVVIENDF